MRKYMTIDECNEHIRRYIKNDKTRRAIMLTAPWGSGKSYYITHHLSPYLNKHELTCVIVSLYGLNSIKDINKELFLEIKFQRFRRKLKYINPFFKTITSGIAGVGKTLLKNLANIDLNLNLSEPNYKKLYESVNLKDKLIIFEDIERSSINLADFMGYVNNLVEQDGIKVLLVANEDEIFRCSQRTDNDELEEKTYSNYLPGAKEYIRFKEKTVGDTIKFYPSLEESIEAILGMFEGDLFDLVVKDNVKCICTKIIDNVMLLKSIDTINLRSLIYACQKTIDMFERITSNADKDFLEHVFMSHIAFVLRKDTYDNLKWESTIDTDCNLGTPKYPIYKFSYDFITAQRFDNKAFESANNAFCASRDFNNKQDRLKEQLHIIYEYYICKESQVLSAVHFVLTSLKSENDIPFEEYVKLMNYLIAIKWDLECFDLIDSCKKAMFNNLERSVSVTSAQLISSGGSQLETEEQLQEFAQFESEISQLVYLIIPFKILQIFV